MASMRSSTTAVIGILIALALTSYGWFMITGIGNAMPIGLLTVLFWVGFTMTWLLCVVLNPIMMITRGEGEWMDTIFGVLAFFAGSFIMMVSYYIVPPILTILDSMGSGYSWWAAISDIGWMFLILMWGLLVLVIPNYRVVRRYVG